jgi:hypothetical protein
MPWPQWLASTIESSSQCTGTIVHCSVTQLAGSHGLLPLCHGVNGWSAQLSPPHSALTPLYIVLSHNWLAHMVYCHHTMASMAHLHNCVFLTVQWHHCTLLHHTIAWLAWLVHYHHTMASMAGLHNGVLLIVQWHHFTLLQDTIAYLAWSTATIPWPQ